MDVLSMLSLLRFRFLCEGLVYEGVSFDEDGLVWFDTSVCVEKAESLLCLFGGGGVIVNPG